MQAITALEEKIIELEEWLSHEKQGALYRAVLETVERPLLERILRRTAGNQLKAAKILGINRNTMRAKIRKLGIQPQKWKADR
jgi:two-component system nitrogen regulation response regulator GlnG